MSSCDFLVGSGISHRFHWPKYLLKQIRKRLEPLKFHSDMNKGKNQAATRRPKSGAAKIYRLFTFLYAEKIRRQSPSIWKFLDYERVPSW
jgi:hypothetical protein